MEKYTIYCTKEQTNRAIRLGAPCLSPEDYTPIILPTAEQMCGWLMDNGYSFSTDNSPIGFSFLVYHKDNEEVSLIHTYGRDYEKYKQGILEMIDAVLNHLEKEKQK